MIAEETLEKARYHFERMKITCGKKEFKYELNAFLSSIMSVPEHLLEDYNVKYGLNIPDKRWITKEFKKVAKDNQQALNFFRWWSAENQKIRNNKLFSAFLNKRHISIHRRTVKPDDIGVIIEEKRIDGADIVKFDSDYIIIDSEHKAKPKLTVKLSEELNAHLRIEWYFKDYPEENVLEVCNKLYTLMIKLVKTAVSRF